MTLIIALNMSNEAKPSAGSAGVKENEDAGGRTYPINPASIFRRLGAAVIDAGLLVGIYGLLHFLTSGRVMAGDSTATQDIAIYLSYFVLFTGLFGQTPGKMVAGVIVVDAEGRVPGLAPAIPREVAGKLVSTIAFGLGLVWIVIDRNRQGWHDKIAGTYVVTKPRDGSAGEPGGGSPAGRPGRQRRKRRSRR